MLNIRTATTADAAALLSIYAPHVLHNAITFETLIPAVEDFESRIAKCLQKFPWIVCDDGGVIAGYAYASIHRDREAYQWTCESSVYVSSSYKGKGIGKSLYNALFQILKMQGLINLYAGITLPNDASIKLHEGCGFQKFAEYDYVGYKLGAWYKVGWWKHQLNNHELNPLPPLSFSQLDPSAYTAFFEDAADAIKIKMTNGK